MKATYKGQDVGGEFRYRCVGQTAWRMAERGVAGNFATQEHAITDMRTKSDGLMA